jgi:hypothetical protein
VGKRRSFSHRSSNPEPITKRTLNTTQMHNNLCLGCTQATRAHFHFKQPVNRSHGPRYLHTNFFQRCPFIHVNPLHIPLAQYHSQHVYMTHFCINLAKFCGNTAGTERATIICRSCPILIQNFSAGFLIHGTSKCDQSALAPPVLIPTCNVSVVSLCL